MKLLHGHDIRFTILGNPFYLNEQMCQKLLAICDRKFREYEAEGCQTYFNKKDHLWTLYEYETGKFKIPSDAKRGMVYGG